MARAHLPTPVRKWSALSLAACLWLSAPAAAQSDEGDLQYRFVAGLIDKGMYEMGVREATQFLRDHGSHDKAALARYRLATALFELDRRDEARPHYSTLLEQRSFEYAAESAFRLGQCQLSAEDLDEAAGSFERVLQLDQDYLHGPARFFLAESEFQRGDFASADSHYRRVVREHSDSEHVPGARRGLVWSAWQSGAFDESIKRAKTYLQHHGKADGADEVRVLLGEALLEADRAQEALAAFSDVTTEAYGDASRRGAGFALASLGDHRKSAREFALLLRDFPKSRFAKEATLQVGIQTLRAGDATGAMRALRVAAKSKEPQALYWLAQAEHADGSHDAALRTLDQARKSSPDEALRGKINIARGDVLTALGRTADALSAYESGGSEYSLYAAAVAALNREDTAAATRLVKKLRQTFPETTYATQASLVLGEAHFAAGDLDASARAFATVLEAESTPAFHSQALNRLGWCAYLSEDHTRAAEYFDRLIRQFPDEEAAEEGLYMLGRVLVETGNQGALVRARGAHADYLARYPEGAHRDEVHFAAARIADGEEGIRALESLIQESPDGELAPRALLELGDRTAAGGDAQSAAAYYQQLLRGHARSEVAPQAAYGLGWCRYQLGEFDACASLLESLGGDRQVEQELRAASLELCIWAHTKSGNTGAATKAWRGFVRLTDDDTRRFNAARTLVAAYRDAGQPSAGQRVLDELLPMLEDASLSVEVLIEGAYLALGEGDIERADAQVQVARRRGGPSASVAEATFFVGEARLDEGKSERAIALYREASNDGSPVRANALYKLGFALLGKGEYARAHDAFTSLVDNFATHDLFGESLFLAGEALFRQGELEQAASIFERLRHEAPDHEILPKGLFRLGVTLGQLERWSDCEAALTRLAQLAPEFPNIAEAELWRGRALSAQRKRRAARQAFDRVIASDRGQLAAQARIGIGRLLEGEGRADEALSEFLKVALIYAHDEEVAEALYRAGTCLETLGNNDKAHAQYREVLTKYPASSFATLAQTGAERTRQ